MITLERDHEDLCGRAARILHAMDDTPIPAMDATFYAHYAEELRLIVEELLARNAHWRSSANELWLLWSCDDIVGTYRTPRDAHEARADLQHQLLCEYGRDVELLESVTVTAAYVDSHCPADQLPR